MESVAVTDVPDTPLSTIGGAGIIPLGEPLPAQFTLTLLLLHHLEGDASELRIAGVDAVIIEEGLRHGKVGRFQESFVHEHKLDQVRAEVNSLGTVPRLSLSKESEASVKHEIDHVVSCANVETVAEPIDCHLTGCHSVKHEILQFLQVGVREELCFVHAVSMAQISGFCSSP